MFRRYRYYVFAEDRQTEEHTYVTTSRVLAWLYCSFWIGPPALFRGACIMILRVPIK
jgi:hypothetical protein